MTGIAKIGETPLKVIARELSAGGIGLQFGCYQFRLQSPIRKIAVAVRILYADHPFMPPAPFSDFRMRLDHGWTGMRPAVVASVNGKIWHTWPRRLTVAAMEWIGSWCYFRGAHQQLAVHAAVAAHPAFGKRAIIFPGNSGSGKSTLAATLMMCDWELLSDEIALFELDTLRLTALGRPTILKGESLDLIADRYGEKAVFGPLGKVLDPPASIAHLRPTEVSRTISGTSYVPLAFVFPKRTSGCRPRVEQLSIGKTYSLLGQFGINYRSLGPAAFRATVDLAKAHPGFELFYEDAAEAEQFLRNEFLPKQFPAVNNLGAVSTNLLALDRDHPAAFGEPVPSSPSVMCPPVDSRIDGPNNQSQAAETYHPIQALPWLTRGMRSPAQLAGLSLQQWDALIPLANHAALLPTLAYLVEQSSVWQTLEPVVQSRLAQEIQQSRFNRVNIRFELLQLERILEPVANSVVLLKGAAYIQANFPWAQGRQTTDIDIVVPENALEQVESLLTDQGYSTDEDLAKRDRLYFRRWLHELPPLRHSYRGIEVDVHFRLLPLADPLTFPVDDWLRRAVPLPDGRFRMLDPVDRVFHAILNLARTGEFRRALRDLWDICSMVGSAPVGNTLEPPGFAWDILIERVLSTASGLGLPVTCVLLLAEELFGLDIPDNLCHRLVQREAAWVRRSRLFRCMRTAAVPEGETLRTSRRQLAIWRMEHYPLPRLRTWLDPLTWTKRVQFMQEQ